MKTIIKIAIALIIGAFIGYMAREGDSCPHYFDAGYDVAYESCERDRQWIKRHIGHIGLESDFIFYSGTQWMEDPPTIMTNCWTACEETEPVSWKEYVERYHASKMKLDNPGGEL